MLVSFFFFAFFYSKVNEINDNLNGRILFKPKLDRLKLGEMSFFKALKCDGETNFLNRFRCSFHASIVSYRINKCFRWLKS